MIKRLVCATSGTHVARCVKWFGRWPKSDRTVVKSRKVERAVGGRMKRASPGTRASVVEFRAGNCEEEQRGVREENVPVPEAQRRPFFTARTSVSGPRSPRNTNKNGGLGAKTGVGRAGGPERYGAKEENGKDGNQVARDRGGREAEKGRPA